MEQDPLMRGCTVPITKRNKIKYQRVQVIRATINILIQLFYMIGFHHSGGSKEGSKNQRENILYYLRHT